MSKRLQLEGERRGRLLVLSLDHIQHGKTHWRCRCDCGNEVMVSVSNLRPGLTQSCGCIRRESITQHGHAGPKSPTYVSWSSMLRRVNPDHPRYADWGGRGITVCERWRSFENFLADMGERPAGRTLDRWPDRNGNYEPGNCRWATPLMQARNTNSFLLTDELAREIQQEWHSQPHRPAGRPRKDGTTVGVSVRQLAVQFGVSHRTVLKALHMEVLS